MATAEPNWRIKMLYDGQCPLCSREVAMLERRNARGLMAFEDIADPAFDPGKYGLTLPQVVGAMHAVRPDGSIVRGVDVFAKVYEAAGWNWLARLLRWRVTRPAALLGYNIFAAVRPKLSRFKPEACAGGSCKVPAGKQVV
jgi:predicted DCC family thiol-disulfide oxidoreductase YuxK